MHWFLWGGLAIILLGLLLGFGVAPYDVKQGEVSRIIYLHVPSAWLSLQIYFYMAVLSGVFLIWRIKMLPILAITAAKVGVVFTGLALVTGMIWGAPTWEAIWNSNDIRLMSMALLFFVYIGLILLYYLVPDKQTANQAFSIMTIIGVVLLPIIRYSVHFNQATLHQEGLSPKSTDSLILLALLVSTLGFVLFAVGIGLNYARVELLQRERHKRWVQELVD